MELLRNILPSREQLRGGARRLIGAALLGQSVILGVQTAEATLGDDRRPSAYIFQDGLENFQGNDAEEFSNYAIINGFALNALAVGALAISGGRMLRGRQHNEAEPVDNNHTVQSGSSNN